LTGPRKKGPNSSRVKEKMRRPSKPKQNGFTLIELLVGIVICGLLIGGIYRVFIAQGRTYVVQDQVAEVQQGIRTAMEILLRDLRMAGFDDDDSNSAVTITQPLVYPLSDNSVTVNYEYYDANLLQYQRHTVAYWLDGGSSRLMRQLTVNDVAGTQEILLENVSALNFTYGVDGVRDLSQTQDGVMDDRNSDGKIDDNDWLSAATVNAGSSRGVAVRLTLTARPEEVNPDLREVSPRTLVSAVTLRNLCLMR